MRVRIESRRLVFCETAWTSRGKLDDHDAFYVCIEDGHGRRGVGECAPLKGLSPEYDTDVESRLRALASEMERGADISQLDFTDFSSGLMAYECALRSYRGDDDRVWSDSPFARGEIGLPINGLVWMGEIDVMLRRAHAKYDQGFRCLKFKIGSKAFDDEMRMIDAIRSEFGSEIEIRVDANCAYDADFAIDEVLPRLRELGVHSIEQPTSRYDVEQMRRVSKAQIVPIALDEALIGVCSRDEKERLLDEVMPQYIILKPTLCGGLSGADQWIDCARERGIGYWATSALESNVGLLHIAQWASELGVSIPQGLGTGMIYTNNLNQGLSIRDAKLWFDPKAEYERV